MNALKLKLPNRSDNRLRKAAPVARGLHQVPGVLAAVREDIASEFASLRLERPRFLELALNEAESLAWQSGYPELVFPLLAREKAQGVAAWHERQQSILQPGPALALSA